MLELSKKTIEQKPLTCQVCRKQSAEVKGKTSKGTTQWRCQICHDLKNRIGFTNKKQ
jgi:transposase-like protein